MNPVDDAAAVARAAEGLFTGRSWVKLALYAVGAIAAAVLLYTAAYRLLFAGRDVAKAHGEAVVASETGNAAAATGAEAVNTVSRTYEYHTQVDHIVKEGQADVEAQNSFEGADAAGAAALCGMHNDLCRPGSAAAP